MINSIPKERLVIWIGALALLPIFFSLVFYISSHNEIRAVNNQINTSLMLAETKETKQAINRSVRENYREADRFYIDKNIETITLLEPEIKSLQEIVNNKNFAGDERVKRRLDFLTGPDNKILMVEGNIQTYPLFQEVISTLSRPVEINVDDLKQLLSLMEGVDIPPYTPAADRPQLIVLDFKLTRKEGEEGNEVYQLNMKLLKREYQ